MNLSEKIMDLRKRSGWSQEELAARLGVSRQSVSKWEIGESVPDIDRIIRMSELWDVSTDYLLKENSPLRQRDAAGNASWQEDQEEDGSGDEPGSTGGGGIDDWPPEKDAEPLAGENGAEEFGTKKSGAGWRQSHSQMREVTRAEAMDFLALSRYASPRIAFGVMLCILSPICLFLLGALSEHPSMFGGLPHLSENLAYGIGVSVLLAFVGIAVEIFVATGMKLSTYEYMEKEVLFVPEDVLLEVASQQADYESTFRGSTAVGVLLCVLGAIPLFLSSAFFDEDFAMAVGLCILLVLVAVGVFFLVSAGIIHSSHEKLLQTGDYAPEKKRANKMMGVFAAVFWCGVVALYLLISFSSFHWELTWIIFPVAGVLFGGISALIYGMSR